jgi:dihydroneopterin aldolase
MYNFPENNYDTVLIEEFELDASVGVFDWEKKILQKLVFDVSLFCDFSKASASDDISDAVNYVEVCQVIERITLQKHYQLLEALVEDITQEILQTFALEAVLLSIRKPGAVPKAKQVGVKAFRSRQQSKTD